MRSLNFQYSKPHKRRCKITGNFESREEIDQKQEKMGKSGKGGKAKKKFSAIKC
jgi:hypothetical protein